MPDTILVVDDEPAARYSLRRLFEKEFDVIEASTAAEARHALAAHRADVILLDHNMPGGDGLSLLRELAAGEDGPAIVMITAHGSERLAVEAMKAGAYDYLAKPYEIEEVRLVVARAMERQRLRGEVSLLRERLAAEGEFGAMIGASRPMRDLFVLADRIAATDLPVLILGESGAGKDLLAQEIHARSRRSAGRFVALNCAALPETLVESELFGYVKGAFTGAVAARAGKFEQAHCGTLFLDEIGDMTAATQAKILRAVESGAVERLGDSKPVPVDVRLISATNQDLEAAVQSGDFRQDLFFRLAGVTLEIPPLRRRAADIPLLVEHFWRLLREKYGRPGPELTREALGRLEAAPWPGNVRQLKNAVERLFVLAREERATLDDVELAIGHQPASSNPVQDLLAADDYREARQRFEAAFLTEKLRAFGGNVTRTAAAIGLERQSLQEKIRKLGIER
jgi:DNA-binding NtrC family response regulator